MSRVSFPTALVFAWYRVELVGVFPLFHRSFLELTLAFDFRVLLMIGHICAPAFRSQGHFLSTTEFFVFQQSFYWTRCFDPETRAFFGYTSKLSKQIHLYFFVALSRCCYYHKLSAAYMVVATPIVDKATKKYKWICLESLDVYPKKARVSGSKRRVQ